MHLNLLRQLFQDFRRFYCSLLFSGIVDGSVFFCCVSPMSIFFPSLCWKWNEAEREDVGQTSVKWRQGPLRSVRLCWCQFASVFCPHLPVTCACEGLDKYFPVPSCWHVYAKRCSKYIHVHLNVYRYKKQQGGKQLLKPEPVLSAASYLPEHARIHTSMFTSPQCHPDIRSNSFVYFTVRAACCNKSRTKENGTNVMRKRTKWLWQAKKQAHIHSFNSALTFCNCWPNQA